jgi:hypothetical protein
VRRRSGFLGARENPSCSLKSHRLNGSDDFEKNTPAESGSFPRMKTLTFAFVRIESRNGVAQCLDVTQSLMRAKTTPTLL